MNKIYCKTLVLIATLLMSVAMIAQNAPSYKLHKYVSTDGGIISSIAPDGKWAVINIGMTGGADNINCPSQLFNMATGEHFTVSFNGTVLKFNAVSSVQEDGTVTIVGSMGNRALAYKFNPSSPTTPGTPKLFTRSSWSVGSLTEVTADGRYAVGHFTGYLGQEIVGAELNGDFWYSALLVDLVEGKDITPDNLPKGDRNGHDQHAIKLNDISADGRYILGEREWYIPDDGFPFIYDMEKKDFTPISFTRNGNIMTPENGISYLDFPYMSPNGKYVGGLAVKYTDVEGSSFAAETRSPYRYDVETGEITIFDDNESSNVEVGCIDDNGTIFGNPDSGSPLRNFKIFYQDKFWIPFSQLCSQYYGFNFSAKTGFEFSGTAVGVSGDGRRFIAFSDPQDESYAFDFGTTVEEACSNFDLLANYTVSPQSGSAISKIKTIEINFGRAVQVVGKGNTHAHIFKKGKNGAADELLANGLSTAAGLQLKEGSKTIVNVSFRNANFDDGEDYYFILDPGAIAVASDEAMVNRKPIRSDYKGRKEGAVKVLKVVPEDGSSLKQLDPAASYVRMTFDCPVKLTGEYEAYLERVEDNTRLATFSVASGNTDETKNQILLMPTSTIFLYDGVQYNVVLSAGSVSDYSGEATSYNEAVKVTYVGSYVREVGNETTMFFDDFNDPNASLGKWMNYEGDHQKPLAVQAEWGFDADNTPWNFSTHDSVDDPDYYATSHSLYAPSGQSDDWMFTPQLQIPADGKAVLEFDAQKYALSKNDHLWIYVYEQDRNFGYLNDNNMATIKQDAELLDEIELTTTYENEKASSTWKHYSYNLNKWAGKNIYIAFVNKNNNQSVVLLDNVIVQREILYTIGFSNDERVVGLDKLDIKGTFTVKAADFQSGDITIILQDADKKEIARREFKNVSNVYNSSIPLSFSNPLPLSIGQDNKFYIAVSFNGKDKNGEDFVKSDVLEGNVFDLAFRPTKRVVLEEMTGTSCPNCPQGIISIEACERQYGENFIPVSIHSYPGDDMGSAFGAYTSFLGLNGAPSARINRIEGTYYPMYGAGDKVYHDLKEQQLWYNIVAEELDKPALCDLDLTANYSADKKKINYNASVKYAVNATQQTSLFVVVLEDGIVYMQENNFAQSEAEGLGEWGLGGKYGNYYAYPVTHNDVVRAVIGDTFAGTIGLFPSSFVAGQAETTTFSSNVPSAASDLNSLKAVAMLIDTQTGEIINAARAKINEGGANGIEDVVNTKMNSSAVYNLSGVRVSNNGLSKLPAGVYIQNGKVIVRK